MQASYGGDIEAINALVGTDATRWIENQFQQAPSLILPELLAIEGGGVELATQDHNPIMWRNMLAGDDQLRQRTAFALSQILVATDTSNPGAKMAAYYQDILTRNAFGNYRDLLEEVTYSPLMAVNLTYMSNRKGDPDTGRMPDENYARELLQLFTIGLVELNPNGTPKLDGQGRAVELFDNRDITGLAKVFTGFSWKGDFKRFKADEDRRYNPIVAYPEFHSELEKSFLGLTIPAGTDADTSVDMALDHIFNHPNVGPFLARQMIQRFTQSNPDPAYVERVAYAFDQGEFRAVDGTVFGTGRRGDLQAMVAAILLDDSLWRPTTDEPNYRGKVREPVLRFAQFVRAFNLSNLDVANERRLIDTGSPGLGLGMHPHRSPSVFNFYRPGFVPPGTESGAAGLTVPEFQVTNEGATIGFLNFMTWFVYNDTFVNDPDYDTFIPDYSTELAMAEDVPSLVDHLDLLLTGGTMTDVAKQDIIDIVTEIKVRPFKVDEDSLTRVQLAIILTINTPAYTVLR